MLLNKKQYTHKNKTKKTNKSINSIFVFQTEAEDEIQYAALDFSMWLEKTEMEMTERERRETVYSEIASFGWE